MSVAPPPVTYRIDAEGKIVYVNAQWDIFAQQNDGEAALSARVLGRPLASFQSDSTVRMLVVPAATTRRAAPISLHASSLTAYRS